MRSVQYGSRRIEYSFEQKEGIKSHYIAVDKHSGVVLKGKAVPPAKADQMILKKAKWILQKLELVKSSGESEIVTGYRIPYLGKSYYAQVLVNSNQENVSITFNYSRFMITVPGSDTTQEEIHSALQAFYKEKALDKITPRVKKLSLKTGLVHQDLQFRYMKRRWGSCTGKNRIVINTDAVKLPYSLIDYLIVHELVHTKVKDHSKAFWRELAKHAPNWKVLEESINTLRL